MVPAVACADDSGKWKETGFGQRHCILAWAAAQYENELTKLQRRLSGGSKIKNVCNEIK